MREREYPEQDLERQVADLTAKLKAKDSALEFAKAAIGDAIYLEDGLDGETGQRVQRLIVEALERGTCDAPGEIADFLTTRERVTQDQITDLTAKLAVSEKDRERLISSNQHWHTRVEQMNNEVEDLTRRLEEAQGLVTKAQDLATTRGEAIATLTERWTERRRFYKTKYREARKQRDALQAKFAAAEQERDTMRTALLALPVVEGEIFIEKVFTCNHWEVRLRGEGWSIGLGYFYWEDHANHYAALLRLAQAMRT